MSEGKLRKRILIVEDSMGVAQALQRALSLYNNGQYRAASFNSGEAALENLYKEPVDLLITDLRLPGMDGLDLIKHARRLRPQASTILITAFGSAEVEARTRETATAYLPKPFRLQDLIHLIERVLGEAAELEQPATQEPTPQEKALPVEVVEKRKNAHLLVLAFDLDGTLAEDGLVAPETWETLRAAKTAGLVFILVTGRMLDNDVTGGQFGELCEAIVAENGAVVFFPRRNALVSPFGQIDPAVLGRLESLDIPLNRGIAIAATNVPHDEAVLKALRETRSSATIEYNRAAVMALPPGASKGSGLQFALQELGYSMRNVVACGDAENDRSLFEIAELAVAVANAEPGAREVADTILPLPNGAGARQLVQCILNGRDLERKPRPGRLLLLGERLSRAPVHLDPFSLVENNFGIFGSSGSGKSWLAGLLAEEMLRQGYQVCILDPEGDYRGLGVSPHTLLMGGRRSTLPPVEDVLNICEWNMTSLVLDLTAYERQERIRYVTEFLRALRGLRSRRGRPHWFLVDEIQYFCPMEGSPLTDLFLESMQWGGFSVIGYRPSQVAPAILEALDHLLLTRLNLPEEIETLAPYVSKHGDAEPILEQLPILPKKQAYLCLDSQKPSATSMQGITRFWVHSRSIPHVRHLQKYLRVPLSEEKRFYFHDRKGRYLKMSAANLWEFREAIKDAPLESLRYHLERGDFENWLQDIIHDDELTRQVHKIAGRKPAREALRAALLDVVIQRYEELDELA